MDILDEPSEESKAPAYDPFSGGKQPPQSDMFSKSKFATTVITGGGGGGGGKKGGRKKKGGQVVEAQPVKGGFY